MTLSEIAADRPTNLDSVTFPSHLEARSEVAVALTASPTDGASGDMHDFLKLAGMRPTKQRQAIVKCMFGTANRHLTAEMLFEELLVGRVRTSLATVYNTLNLLLNAGLLRQVCVDGSKTYFDTKTDPHQHFYFEDSRELVDIPYSEGFFGDIASPSEEYDLARIDVIVRVRKKRAAGD